MITHHLMHYMRQVIWGRRGRSQRTTYCRVIKSLIMPMQEGNELFFLYCLKQARFLTHEWLQSFVTLFCYSPLYAHNIPFPNGCHVTCRGWHSFVPWINLSDRDLLWKKKRLFNISYPWKTKLIQTIYKVCNKNNKNGAFMSQSSRAYKPQGLLLLPA